MKKLQILIVAMLVSFSSVAFASGKTILVDVDGLVCDFCARATEKVFRKNDAVEDIKVDLTTKVITITFKEGKNMSDDEVTKGVLDAGYNVREIRRDAE